MRGAVRCGGAGPLSVTGLRSGAPGAAPAAALLALFGVAAAHLRGVGGERPLSVTAQRGEEVAPVRGRCGCGPPAAAGSDSGRAAARSPPGSAAVASGRIAPEPFRLCRPTPRISSRRYRPAVPGTPGRPPPGTPSSPRAPRRAGSCSRASRKAADALRAIRYETSWSRPPYTSWVGASTRSAWRHSPCWPPRVYASTMPRAERVIASQKYGSSSRRSISATA